MAKGPIITDDIKHLIGQVFLENPGRRAKEIQAEVSRRVNKNGEDWPSLSVVEKLLVDIRKQYRDKTLGVIDKPWHLGCIRETEYQIDPESIPDILLVQDWCNIEHPEVTLFVKGETVSTRQAMWIARLHGITNLLRSGKAKGQNKNLDINFWLWSWSKAYAYHEILCEISNTDYDTTKLDNAIWNGAIPITASNAIDVFYMDDTFEIIIEIEAKDGEK